MSDLTDYEVSVLRHFNGDVPTLDTHGLPDAINKLQELGLIALEYVTTEEGKRVLWSRTKYEGAKG